VPKPKNGDTNRLVSIPHPERVDVDAPFPDEVDTSSGHLQRVSVWAVLRELQGLREAVAKLADTVERMPRATPWYWEIARTMGTVVLVGLLLWWMR
jgi:hypothetical protein